MFKILNPVNGGHPFCGPARAAKYIRQGRAILVRELVIRFVEQDHRHVSAVVSNDEKERRMNYDIASETGVASALQLAGIPIVSAREMLAPRGRLISRPKFMRVADVNGTYGRLAAASAR